MAELLGVAASVIAVIQISQSVITQAYQYGQAVKRAKKDTEKIEAEMKDIGNVLIKLRDLARRAESSGRSLDNWPTLVSMRQTGGPLSACEMSLNCLLTELAPVDGLARIKERAFWPHKVKKVEKSLHAIRQQKKYFIEALGIEQAGGVLEIEGIAAGISKIQTGEKNTPPVARIHTKAKSRRSTRADLHGDENRDRILKWLSQTDPTINHNAACERHEPQTGDWFIQSEDYYQWKEMPSSFLWLHGIPGCGKTILCSTIIEHTINSFAATQDHSIAYYYFSFNDTEKQKACNFLRSILAQLAHQRTRLPDSLQSLYNNYRHGQPPIRSLKTVLRSLLEQAEQTFIIVDALDECSNDEERTQLFATLKDFSKWALPNLHILVTGRMEQDIKESLAALTTFPPVCIDAEKLDTDVLRYIKSQLADDVNLKEWSPEIKREIETTLMEGARGMFRWVFCQLDALKKCLKPIAIKKALKSLPKTLDDTYARILLNIDSEYHHEAITALNWLAASTRPLQVTELAEAAVINPQAEPPFNPENRLRDPYYIVRILSSLVTVSRRRWDRHSHWKEPKEVEEIRLAHFSVKEYLTSTRLIPELKSFLITDTTAHRAIAENSLFYIISYSHAETKSSTEEDFEKFPLLQYACRLWYKHVTLDQNVIENYIGALIFNFFTLDLAFSSWSLVHQPDCYWQRPFDNENQVSAPPLYYASYVGLQCIARLLVEEGADVNAQGGEYGNALQAASQGGHAQIFQLILESGADVNAQGGYFGNALQAASYRGHVQIVQQLLESGADVNTQGGYYGNALQAASYMGHVQIVQQLLESGADVNAQGGRFDNALQAASYEGHAQIVQQLLESGADVNTQGGDFGNALKAASYMGHVQIVQQLLESGADVNAQGGYFGNALQAASYRGHAQIVQQLLESGADVNAQGGYFGSALQAASYRGHAQIVQQLLESGADVNAQGGKYDNALQAAAARGQSQIVQLLLENGAVQPQTQPTLPPP